MGAETRHPSWRDRMRPIVAGVIARVGVDDMRTLRHELRAAFSAKFGQRKLWPYKVFLSEVRRQLAELAPKPERTDYPLFAKEATPCET